MKMMQFLFVSEIVVLFALCSSRMLQELIRGTQQHNIFYGFAAACVALVIPGSLGIWLFEVLVCQFICPWLNDLRTAKLFIYVFALLPFLIYLYFALLFH